ncbi:MAG: type II secretion system F family protein [Bacillota bacterium]|nr:type II secretion system F family protein [Bacillota bacterium]
MPSYRYRAADATGRLIQGVLAAEDRLRLLEVLRSRGYYPLEAVEVREETGAVAGARGVRRLARRERCALIEALADLIGAGIQVDRALEILEEAFSPAQRALAAALRGEVQAGLSLSEAMEKHSRDFSPLQAALVRAGETSGHLGPVLRRLADALWQEEEVRGFVRTTLIYPLILLGVSAAVTAILLIAVVPRFAGVLSGLGRPLPAATRLLLAVSGFLGCWWWLLILAMGAGAVLAALGLRRPEVREFAETLLLRLPVAGRLVQGVQTAHLLRTLGLLLRGGVALVQALELAAPALENLALRRSASTLAHSRKC